MRSAKLTTTAKFFVVLLVTCGSGLSGFAQENSPYSRYGIGDLVPNPSVTSRAMGGLAAAFVDHGSLTRYQSINFNNPASYGNLTSNSYVNTIFEIGTDLTSRTLKSQAPAKKYNSTNLLFSYLQLGFPIAGKKLEKKGTSIGLVLGFRPVSRINYKIENRSRLSGIDSLYTLYEGTGGATQAYAGTGIKIKNFSIGFNAGYMFGNKNYSTRLEFINDTVIYYKSNHATETRFGGLFANAGMQYVIPMKAGGYVRIGAYGSLEQKLKAKQDVIRETFAYDPNSNEKYRLDSVYIKPNVKGELVYPATFGGGFVWQSSMIDDKNKVKSSVLVGADFEYTNWANYRFYNQADYVQNAFTFRAGGQFTPAVKLTTGSKVKYLSLVKYRAGFYYSNGYIKLNQQLPEFAGTFGAAFPLTTIKTYTREFATLNTSLEIGGRGNKNSNVRESITRFSIGLTMNALWFIKRKYD